MAQRLHVYVPDMGKRKVGEVSGKHKLRCSTKRLCDINIDVNDTRLVEARQFMALVLCRRVENLCESTYLYGS